jgi:hypothetical protein
VRSHNFNNIPDELKAISRWVNWRLLMRKGRLTKVPVQARNPKKNASSTDPDTWCTHEEAVAALEANDFLSGIGFVFSDEDDICGIDIDHARDPETGELSAEASTAVALLDSYTEVSPSGEGLHIIVHGKVPAGGNKRGGFEVYERGRFFTMPGTHLEGTRPTIESRQDELEQWHHSVFGEKKPQGPRPTTTPSAHTLIADDEDLLASLRRSKTGKRKFEMLFDFGDWEHAGDFGSQSEADLALCSFVAAKTDNPAQIDRLFRRSALMRDKWDEQHGAMTYGEMTIEKALEGRQSPSRAPAQRDKLFAIAEKAELFHTPRGEAFATIVRNGHHEVLRVTGAEFREWLLYEYYTKEGTAPGKNAMTEALPTIIAKAQIEGPEREVFTRLAEQAGRIYIDLGDETRSVVEVTPEGWRVLTESPVPFFRTSNTKALPVPAGGGDIRELRHFVNVATDADFVLLVSWLIGAMHPSGPYPLLVLQGEQGSAKSTTSRVVRSLVDPGVPSHRAVPTKEWDLMVAAQYTRVLAFDNLSGLSPAMSDVFCQLATGAGFGARKLYTDDDEKIFSAKRPVLVNGISDIARREDLASRSIVLRLPHIAASKRRRERDIDAAFEAARPSIFGALLDGLSRALRNAESIELDSHPRMADFAVWMTAAEPALGFAPGTFLAAYEANRAEVIHTALEGDAIAAGVLALVYPTGEFTGTMTELLHELNVTVAQEYRTGRWWPDTPRGLSDRLTRLGDFFHSVGVSVERHRETTGERRNLVAITHDRAIDRVHIDPCMLDAPYRMFKKPAKGDSAGQDETDSMF